MADDPPPIAHPRDVFDYSHGEAVEASFLAALSRGRLHHGWLLTGPEGVGKATFAYRAARRLLGARPDANYGLLGAAPDDRVSRLVAARSHPDLLILERIGDDGKPRKVIPVDDARRLPEFFSKAPAMGGWRIAIVDSVDDMNPSSSNALLKTLEEPPQRGMLFLVSHAPGGLLDTIRSRCRRLRFAPWQEAAVAAFLLSKSNVSEEDALRLAHMSGGAPGRALALGAAGAIAADDAARGFIDALPALDAARVQALAETFRGSEAQERFSLAIQRLSAQARRRALLAAETGAGGAERWAAAQAILDALPGEVDGLNLDRGDALWTAIGELRRAARS
ncbi:MAG TPA: DNA polymerase III subunit delta' [Caulobacteraceae bacterium]|nr:DNA polymerase III subunit delta' [Caulobacteraceae bacterium]